jgi:hypothetical protein
MSHKPMRSRRAVNGTVSELVLREPLSPLRAVLVLSSRRGRIRVVGCDDTTLANTTLGAVGFPRLENKYLSI